MQECVCCAVLAKALFNVMSWGGKQEGALLFCCPVTNHWSRAVFRYSFPLVSLPALVRGLPHGFALSKHFFDPWVLVQGAIG